MSTFDIALNYLTYKPRTEKEIRDYLKRKKIRKDEIENTVKKLKEYNYINDCDYVQLYLKNNDLGKRFGLNKINFDLIKKGIKKSDLEVLQEIPEETFDEYCKYHFNKILSQTESLPYKKRMSKIIRYLNSKGFDYSMYSSLIIDIPKETMVDEVKFKKDLKHYIKLYTNKGYKSRELKNRIIKGLLSKGYEYSYIIEILNQVDLNGLIN